MVKLKPLTAHEQCLLSHQKKPFKEILEKKDELLQKELELEQEFFEEHGLNANRSTEEIEEEIETIRHVIKNIDKIPICKN